MNVKELKLILENIPDDTPILICGVYGSEGIIEKAYVDIKENNTKLGKKTLIIESDICSG